MSVRVLHGDCREVLRALDTASVHAVVTDPPYHLTSIVKRFGGANAAPAQFGKDGAFSRASRGFMGKTWDGGDIAQDPELWAEVLRVMKPGAHLAAFGGTRTFHRMACAIEDAGFEVRDCLSWLYGSGFPKSHNLPGGLGTALKPAWEPIILARKPLIGTVAANVQAHGTGAINVDACRVAATGRPLREKNLGRPDTSGHCDLGDGLSPGSRAVGETDLGRWPANVCTDGSDEVEAAFAAFGERASGQPCGTKTGGQGNAFGRFGGGIPVTGIGDSGSASRFFFCGKATAEDRAGSKHPTVKPLALMDWLVKLITPPGGTVLDPFAGSGTTLLAADRLGFDAIGIEQDAEYVRDIHRRMQGDCPLFAEVSA